jgi:hypothetical protein
MLAVQTARAANVGGVAAYGDAFLVGAGVAAAGVVLATFVRSRRDEGAAGGDALDADQPAEAGLVAAVGSRAERQRRISAAG